MKPEYVRGFIERHNMTQGAYGELVGVSIRTVRDWLAGHSAIPGPAQRLTLLLDIRPELIQAVREMRLDR